MAKRYRATQFKQRGRAASGKYSQRVSFLLAQRDDLMSEIAIVRSQAKMPLPFFDNARTLLTRFWSGANWQSREEILRAARWLLSVGKIQYVGTSPQVHPRKTDLSRIKR